MKVADILNEVAADDETKGHITAKTFMDVMRTVQWPALSSLALAKLAITKRHA